MSDINLSGVNPIPLTAVVTSDVSGYKGVLQYDLPPPTTVCDIDDSFATVPATVTVQVSSTTVPASYYLEAKGGGTWTALSGSSLSGTFATPDDYNRFDFSILVTNGSVVLVRIDPRMIIRKLGSGSM